jgi:hypothetical protein
MCIATTLILSLVFQIAHSIFQPFKLPACNRLQQLCLSILNLVYVAGSSASPSTFSLRPAKILSSASPFSRTFD